MTNREPGEINSGFDKPVSQERSTKLRTLLEQTGLRYQLPYQKLRDALKPKSIRKLDESPEGIRDQRGEEDLFPPLFGNLTHPEEGVLPVVFIGNAHYPFLQKKASEHGFTAMITSADSVENLNNKDTSDLDEQNGIVSILEHAKYYNSEKTLKLDGYPMLVVGDSHGNKYKTEFPNPESLKQLGISLVKVFVEDEKRGQTSEKTIKSMKSGFWGKANLARYLERLQDSGITLDVIGIEPDSTSSRSSRFSYIETHGLKHKMEMPDLKVVPSTNYLTKKVVDVKGKSLINNFKLLSYEDKQPEVFGDTYGIAMHKNHERFVFNNEGKLFVVNEAGAIREMKPEELDNFKTEINKMILEQPNNNQMKNLFSKLEEKLKKA